MEKRYAQQMIEWSETAKQTLTVRKEIIIDDNLSDEQLGIIIRQMYRAKLDAENESIERCKQYI
jgi:hypothetical protein